MLGWSITLFRVGETQVRLHPTFFLLLAVVALTEALQGGTAAALYGVVFVSILFLCVVLHEFGHVFAARRYGIKTPDVTLWPFGGVASMESMPEKPGQEIIVALAGPAVNVVIAVGLTVILGVRFDLSQVAQFELAQSTMLAQVAAANIALVVFNLIPAFPMDGGRVLRALLAIRMGLARATQVAATIGQGIAVVLGVLGLFGNPMLIIIAIFIFLAASGEAGFVQARVVARAHVARDAMITAYVALPVTATVDDAARQLLATTQQEFPVVDGAGRLRGMVTRDGIVGQLSAHGGAVPVLDMMVQEVPSVAPNTSLEQVFTMMQKSQSRFMAVTDTVDQRLLGYISQENIAELIMIRTSQAHWAATSRMPHA